MSVSVSQRLRKLGPDTIDEIMLLTAKEFYREWSNKSQSTTYWRLGASPQAKPLKHKLTVRSGDLRNALKEGAQIVEIRNVGGKWSVTKGIYGESVPYANKQEKWNSGQRAFLEPSAKATLRKLSSIKRNVIEKWKRLNGG